MRRQELRQELGPGLRASAAGTHAQNTMAVAAACCVARLGSFLLQSGWVPNGPDVQAVWIAGNNFPEMSI